MDFGGTDHAIRLVSLHPGVTVEHVRDATGFDLEVAEHLAMTPLPDAEQLAIIARLDPHDIRASVIKGNPKAEGRS